MKNLPQCIVQEEGLWLSLLLLVIALFVIIVGLFITWTGIRALIGRSGSGDEFAMKWKDYEIKVHGTPAKVLVIVIGIVLVLAFPFLSWYLYDDYLSTRYFVAFDTPEIRVTLEQLRGRYIERTDSPILLSDRAKKFEVIGSFEGDCISDMFRSICNKYAGELDCAITWFNGTMVE